MTSEIDHSIFEFPHIALSGTVDHGMYQHFKTMLSQLPKEGDCVVELATLGGDPEVARMMGEDVRFHSDLYPGRRIVFFGKAAVYSAGATFMGFFAVGNRYLARGTRLMIHERIITKTIDLHGPLTGCISPLKTALNEIEASIAIQNEGFENLVLGSSVDIEELKRRATENWYLEAQEAFNMGLVAAVI